DGTTLDDKLPLDVQGRINTDEALSKVDPPIASYGALFKQLIGDDDGDRLADVDALQLGRFLPNATQQTILRALQATIAPDELAERLHGVGFDNAIGKSLS